MINNINSKRYTDISYSYIDTWEELWMCEYNKPQGKQTQLSCQALCVDDLECIGISQNLRTHECFLCTDEIMKPLDNDHGEYFRMPPRMSPRF